MSPPASSRQASCPVIVANGANVPAIGLGTWQLTGERCTDAVVAALQTGYRHIDTAAMYGNEAEVGRGLRKASVARDDIFVTTKVWMADIGRGALQKSAQTSLGRLQLDAVDLLLIHWPSREIPMAESIEALCDAKAQGYARHIGVSNFPVALLEDAVRLAAGHGETLSANQCEFHPQLDQSRVIAACRRHGLAFTSYSPLGRGRSVSDPTIVRIASEVGRTASQVVLRWHIQHPGVAAVPKAGSRDHIEENFAIFDFELSDAQMQAISALARPDGRLVDMGGGPAWD